MKSRFADTFIDRIALSQENCKQREICLKRIGGDKSPTRRHIALKRARCDRVLRQDYDNCLIKYARAINARPIVVGAAIVPPFAKKYPTRAGSMSRMVWRTR